MSTPPPAPPPIFGHSSTTAPQQQQQVQLQGFAQSQAQGQVPNDRSDLLASITGGKTLKKVDDKPKPVTNEINTSLASSLASAVYSRRSAIESESESGSDDDWESDEEKESKESSKRYSPPVGKAQLKDIEKDKDISVKKKPSSGFFELDQLLDSLDAPHEEKDKKKKKKKNKDKKGKKVITVKNASAIEGEQEELEDDFEDELEELAKEIPLKGVDLERAKRLWSYYDKEGSGSISGEA